MLRTNVLNAWRREIRFECSAGGMDCILRLHHCWILECVIWYNLPTSSSWLLWDRVLRSKLSTTKSMPTPLILIASCLGCGLIESLCWLESLVHSVPSSVFKLIDGLIMKLLIQGICITKDSSSSPVLYLKSFVGGSWVGNFTYFRLTFSTGSVLCFYFFCYALFRLQQSRAILGVIANFLQGPPCFSLLHY